MEKGLQDKRLNVLSNILVEKKFFPKTFIKNTKIVKYSLKYHDSNITLTPFTSWFWNFAEL